MALLNTDDLPADPIDRIIWLDSVQQVIDEELDALYEDAYFHARLTRRFSVAVEVGRASKKRALAWTRRANEKRGRSVRWSDGIDPTSTAYTRSD